MKKSDHLRFERRVIMALLVLAWVGMRAESGYRLLGPKDLDTLAAKLDFEPGDFALLPDAEWENVILKFRGHGTREKPITLRPMNPGKFQLSGKSKLIVEGEWLVVEGVSFRNIIPDDSPAITMVGHHNRLTSSMLRAGTKAAFLKLEGEAHRVDHCYLDEASDKALVVVDAVDDTKGHIFEENRFTHGRAFVEH